MGHGQAGMISRRFVYRLVAGAIVALPLFLAGFFTRCQGHGPALRLPASDTVRTLSPADLPPQIESSSNADHIWAIRRPAKTDLLNPALADAVQFAKDAPSLVASAFREGPAPLVKRALAPLLAQDASGPPPLLAPLSLAAGDTFDANGKPLRWHLPENVLASYSVPRPAPFPMPDPRPVNPQFAAALARLAPSRNAGDYRQLVESFAARYGLNTDLVMAIIHSESNFMPRLVSPKSAMGLMQLLPSTASGEVHTFLYGHRGNINFEQLSVPEINIRYGTAYLHILNDRYFINVHDRQVREACVVASYNMGPNGFLRLYGSTPERAIERINSMSSDEFHEDLPKRLPRQETRFYVEKVRRMKQHYAGMR